MCKEQIKEQIKEKEKVDKLFADLEEVLKLSKKLLERKDLDVEALKIIRIHHNFSGDLFRRILGQEEEIERLNGQINMFTKLTDTQAKVIELLEEKLEEGEMDWVDDDEPVGRLPKRTYKRDHTDESLVCDYCELEQNVFAFAKNPKVCRVCKAKVEAEAEDAIRVMKMADPD